MIRNKPAAVRPSDSQTAEPEDEALIEVQLLNDSDSDVILQNSGWVEVNAECRRNQIVKVE